MYDATDQNCTRDSKIAGDFPKIRVLFPIYIRKTSKRGQSGQALIMMSYGVLFLSAIAGLVVDLGFGYYRKQVLQAAVDAAALAGATQASSAGGSVTCNSGGIVCQTATPCTSATTGSNFYSACKYGVYNGTTNSALSIAAGNSSPYGGIGVNYWVTATATESLPLSFLRVLGMDSSTVTATATAASVTLSRSGADVSGTGAASGACIYVLDPTVGQAFNMNGSNITTGCGVYVNSNNTTNAVFGNGSSLSVGSASLNMVTGAGLFCNGCGSMPTPARGSAVPDPLASLPAPSFSGCNYTNYSYNGSTGATLNPGVYCGGISMNGSGRITFTSGMYILNGGGLKINGTEAVTGSQVFFYNTSSGYASGPLLLNGSGSQTLTPPTSGTYQGILFYQDHSVCPSTSHTVNGGSNLVYTGTIYLHCGLSSGYVAQKVLYNGVQNPNYFQGLVVDMIQFNGASNLYKDPTGTNTGLGLASQAMLVQ